MTFLGFPIRWLIIADLFSITYFQAEMSKKLNEETIPRVLGVLQNFLEGNGGEYFVGSKVQI